MEQKSNYKTTGIGVLSVIISIFAAMFSFTYFQGAYLGQHILRGLGISFPYAIVSIVLFVIAGFIGYKHKEEKVAKAGMIISGVLLGICASSIITSYIGI
ncbi:hypothetical protein [Clostridium sp. B9]|uniref:hypothetical protein n=1 Tax=Clostridium sp. B9 TaxID=3423224 RepID=UPI003D2F50BC